MTSLSKFYHMTQILLRECVSNMEMCSCDESLVTLAFP